MNAGKIIVTLPEPGDYIYYETKTPPKHGMYLGSYIFEAAW